MKTPCLLSMLLMIAFTITGLSAQDLPLVYDVENTGADVPKPSMPPFLGLPVIKSLPDPFRWADTTRGRLDVRLQWRERRAEIAHQLQRYEIGEKPSRPDTIAASYSGGVLTVYITRNGQTDTLISEVSLPSGSGPFPAVIGMNSPNGSIPSSVFTSRNIARITYHHDQVTSYSSPKTTDPFYKLYPELNLGNTGQYSAWAWGVSRLIDGLELVQDSLPIDLRHIAVTGCSYAGKMALFAGAFDERIALTIAQESGGGGATSWRFSATQGTVEQISNTNYNWFCDTLNQFGGTNGWRLPFDHHELMGIVAPRALYATGNPDFTWLSNLSCDVCSRAAKEIYKALGIPDRFGYSIVGGHNHCAVPDNQIPEISAFVDKFLLGKTDVNTNVSTTPYSPDVSPWITWETPPLYDDVFYLETPELVQPENQHTDVDTAVTFVWKSANLAEMYFIQLSPDPAFATIAVTDSSADTSLTVTGLAPAQSYWWRVQARSIAHTPGPWTNLWSFTTKALTGVLEGTSAPRVYSMSQNYPNPFNPVTTIRYAVPQTGYISLKVFDLLGVDVATLFEGVRPPGTYDAEFDGGRLASGMYLYRMKAENFLQTKRFLLLK